MKFVSVAQDPVSLPHSVLTDLAQAHPVGAVMVLTLVVALAASWLVKVVF